MSFEIRDLVHRFDGPDGRPRTVLDISALDLQAGKITAIIGTNGAGKTTLLEILAGLRKQSQGTVLLKASAGDSATTVMAMHPGYMFHGSVRRNVSFGLRAGNWPGGQISQRTDEMLQLFGLADLARHDARKLSAGQKQRVNLARAIAVRPQVLLIDEPISNLDSQSVELVAKAMAGLRDAGRTIIYAAPAAGELTAITDRTIRLESGKVAEDSA